MTTKTKGVNTCSPDSPYQNPTMQRCKLYIVLMVDMLVHTDNKPFCFSDPDCPCREDQEAIQTVQTWVQQGLMTPEEATNFILGRIF